MKQFLLSIFFTTATIFPTFSQVDSTSFTTDKKAGFSFNFGFGVGGGIGADIKQGFARGFSLRYHYRFHTFDTYTSHTTEYQADYAQNGGRDLTMTYDSRNYGVMYGLGIYKEHFSAACVTGIGYTNTSMIYKNLDPYLVPYSIFIHKNYAKTTACFGLQASVRAKIFGLGLKTYYNLSNGLSTYTVLLGLEINFL